ncbi:MAG: amidohydrolase family protein [Burkholderiaceae bacterium]
MHTHVVPEKFPAYAGKLANVRWPSMVDAQPCHRHVMLSGKVYRTVSNQCWDVAVRGADMDQVSTGHQVLSPMPELLAYWLNAEDGRSLAAFVNETIATMVAADPERFSGLGSVPLQDVDAGIAELERAVEEFGLAGVEIGSNIEGVPIGDPKFLPFFEAVRDLGVCVFVHAMRPAGIDRLVGPPFLEQTVAFPGEIGLSAMSLITSGTLSKLPGLRVAFSHGGGSIGVLVPRLLHAWTHMSSVKEAIPTSPLEQARTLFFDDLLYDARAIRALIDLVGQTQVMVGTDYPFAIMDRDPGKRLDSLDVGDETRALLSFRNAMRWLGRPESN